MKTHPFARAEGIILCGSSKAEFTELRPEEFRSPANHIRKGIPPGVKTEARLTAHS